MLGDRNMATSQNASGKIRYAVVGSGWFAQAAAMPAFDQAENSEIVAIVSDDPRKRDELSKQYGSPKQVRMSCNGEQNTKLPQYGSLTSWKTISSSSLSATLVGARCS